MGGYFCNYITCGYSCNKCKGDLSNYPECDTLDCNSKTDANYYVDQVTNSCMINKCRCVGNICICTIWNIGTYSVR